MINNATCSPEEFVDGFKELNADELLKLELEMGERHRFRRAILVNSYAAVKKDFEGR